MLIAEMTAYYKAQNKTLFDALEALYARYGFCMEKTAELEMPGVDGPARMAALMEKLRSNPPKTFNGTPVAIAGDYQAQTLTMLATGAIEPTNLPASNVLSFVLENDDVIVVRPSGTEPKVKFYYLLSGEDRAAVEATLKAYCAQIDALTK
jgi:phosphoglucomutase